MGGGDEAARDPGPEVVERYPYLAGGHPERLPRIEELTALAEDAVIVSTADQFHHGIGYGDPPARSLAPGDGGLELARTTIEQAWPSSAPATTRATTRTASRRRATRAMQAPSFAISAARYRGEIVDMAYTDAAALYESPDPTLGRSAARRVAPRVDDYFDIAALSRSRLAAGHSFSVP